MLSDLLTHNREWAHRKVQTDPDYFKRLANLQKPKYLWIGCSDSRVPANVITGLEPGEVFVHRNVANLVHRGDLNLLSVLEFAVGTLGVEHIILCGHYGCGGIRAALDGHCHGVIDHWLQPVRDVAEAEAHQLERFADTDSQLNRLCELSIEAQVQSLSRTPIIQNHWREGNSLNIHGWVYGLHDGLIRDLNCSMTTKGVENSDNVPDPALVCREWSTP